MSDLRPYYQSEGVTIYKGDCRDLLPALDEADLCLADPPYEETSLGWDVGVSEWLPKLRLATSGSVWCFGSMRSFMKSAREFDGWNFAQDVVWEKHNGSNFMADRFRRVHEHVLQFYRGRWSDVWKAPVKTPDAVKKTVRKKGRPPAWQGRIGPGHYVSEDGGPRLQRSVIRMRSCHSYADHPTQKPAGLVGQLIEYSCPRGGLVVDPFMGSGTTLVAARELGRRVVGIEKELEWCEVAVRRLSQKTLELV